MTTKEEQLTQATAEVERARDDLDNAERKFLRLAGWEFSSGHPDFIWRWSKTINGRNYSFSQEQAVRMEQHL